MEDKSNFRGLLFEPSVEHEAVIFFSLLIPYLEESFVVDEYPDSFPDCFARRNGQKIGIEFETLASSFWIHENSDNLSKCNLLICWKNNIRGKTKRRNGIEILNVRGQDIEIMALDRVYANLLEKKKCPKLILNGKRPTKGGANKERFFEQLEQKVKAVNPEKYGWIKELYDQANQKEDFEIRWGGGETLFTMRFYVKKWDVDPINIGANGDVTIGYQGNPAQAPWELPQEAQSILRKLFNHNKPNKKGFLPKWPSAPLKTQVDLDNVKRALEIFAEYSKRSDIIWR